MLVVVLCFTCLLCSGVAELIPGVATTEHFNNSEVLDTDGNFLLFWNYNDSHVTFEVHVRTRGWVGFGLSGNGNMYPGDVVVGGVHDNGTAYFSDRHTTGHVAPVIDTSQDWHLLLGKEDDFGTVLKFVRRIQTCDATEDLIIQEGTSRIIYAYGTADPADGSSVAYHGTTRGTKSIEVLRTVTETKNAPVNIRNVDFLNNNYIIPSTDTTYMCRGFVMPKLDKHHMIKFDVVVTPGNEMNVHHMVLYRCATPNPQQWAGQDSECYHGHRKLPRCGNSIIAWAIGGKAFTFPPDVGFPIGGQEDDGMLYVLETHFDNPQMLSGMIDNSGIRMTITPDLRPQEAGLWELGQAVSYTQVVPPGQTEFHSRGFCSKECMGEGFTQSNLTEVKVFGIGQHAHLLGAAINTRHYRNGVELKPVAVDPNYDFNFQQIRSLPKEVPVYPGDSFEVECIYDSSKRTKPTLGGLTTRDEMCLSFVYYYPRMKMTSCKTYQTFNNFPFTLRELPHVLETTDWTNKTTVDYFVDNIMKSEVGQSCYGAELQEPAEQKFPPFNNDHPYVAPTPDCKSP